MSNEDYDLIITNDTYIKCHRRLGVKVGLVAALIVQEVADWLNWAENFNYTENHFDGRWWIWKSWNQWSERLPWWGKRTLQRHFKKLTEAGVLLTKPRTREDGGYDCPWYTIDFQALKSATWEVPPSDDDTDDPIDNLTIGSERQNDDSPYCQNDHPKETEKNQEKKESTATDAAAAPPDSDDGSGDNDDPGQDEKAAVKGNHYAGLSVGIVGGKREKLDLDGDTARKTFHPNTALEKYLIEHTGGHNKRTFSKKQREKLNLSIATHRLTGDGKAGEPVTMPSLNQFYDENPDFRRYVTQRIRTLNEIIKNQPGPATQKSVDGAIDSLKDMARPETGWFAWSSDPKNVPPVMPESTGRPDFTPIFDEA